MREGEVYIKNCAVSLMVSGMASKLALIEAKRMWAERQDNERIIDALMAKDEGGQG